MVKWLENKDTFFAIVCLDSNLKNHYGTRTTSITTVMRNIKGNSNDAKSDTKHVMFNTMIVRGSKRKMNPFCIFTMHNPTRNTEKVHFVHLLFFLVVQSDRC